MSDNGFTNVRASSAFDDDSRMGGRADVVEASPTSAHRLDSGPMLARFRKLQEWFDQEWQRQAANRFQMSLDCDYYDGLQWSEEDAQVLMTRNQAPLVFNEIKPTIDWMIGTERRTRIDAKVLGREKNDNDSAQDKSQLLKYLDDTNKTVFHRSRAFADAVRAGLGWMEVGLLGDPTEEMLYKRYESWRNMLYDSNDTTLDLSESRYIFRWKWLDDDIAEAYFRIGPPSSAALWWMAPRLPARATRMSGTWAPALQRLARTMLGLPWANTRPSTIPPWPGPAVPE